MNWTVSARQATKEQVKYTMSKRTDIPTYYPVSILFLYGNVPHVFIVKLP